MFVRPPVSGALRIDKPCHSGMRATTSSIVAMDVLPYTARPTRVPSRIALATDRGATQSLIDSSRATLPFSCRTTELGKQIGDSHSFGVALFVDYHHSR